MNIAATAQDLILVQNFHLQMEAWEKMLLCFWTDMSSSVHIDNKNKDTLILGEEPTQGLYDTTLTAEAKYPINFRQSIKRFVLSLHYNESNSFLFVNATELYQYIKSIMYFLREQFSKYIFLGINFKNLFYEGTKSVLTHCVQERKVNLKTRCLSMQ